MSKNFESILTLEKLVFDEMNFKRTGFKNKDSKLDLNINVAVAENLEEDIYKVSLRIDGNKENEYNLSISLSGFFALEAGAENLKDELLNKNAVAIMMPYMRSQISLLTAQPDTDCVVLPPFNIAAMMERK